MNVDDNNTREKVNENVEFESAFLFVTDRADRLLCKFSKNQ